MHICFIGQYPYQGRSAGGVGTFTQTLGRALVQSGLQVTVLAPYPGVQPHLQDDEGVQVHWYNEKAWRVANFWHNTQTLRRLLNRIHHSKPIDVVETQEAGFAFLPKLPGAVHLIRLHGGHLFFSRVLGKPLNTWKAWQERRSFQRADAFVAVSRYVWDETLRQMGFSPEQPFQVIYNPVDVERFSPALQKSSQPLHLVFAGRLVEKKGIRQLLQAMTLLLPRFPSLQLSVYGGDTTIDLGRSFLAHLQQGMPASTAAAVQFFGEIPNHELPQKLAEAQLIVLPSHLEAMPLAWLEAMSMGKPLVAGLPGPGPEVITHNINGMLCNPHDPEDIARQIAYLLEHPAEAESMGLAARQLVLEQYAVPTIVAQNIAYFNQLVHHRKPI